MEKFNNKTVVWGDQNEKYLRTVVLYGNYDNDCKLYYTSEAVRNGDEKEGVLVKDLADMCLKGLVLIKDINFEDYYPPTYFNVERGGVWTNVDGGAEYLAIDSPAFTE